MTSVKNGTGRGRLRKKKVFYWAVLAFPILQFIIFYVVVNINSFVLAFESYSVKDGYTFAGFKNFADVLHNFGTMTEMQIALRNSCVLLVLSVLVGCTLSVVFSYYIYKKGFLQRFFKIILFLPFIISSITMVCIYRYFIENAIPAISEQFFGREIEGLLTNLDTKLGTIMFYTIWTGFGIQTLIYSSAMSGISDSVIEAACLDGVNALQEFVHVIIPMIYPTIVVFVVSSVAGTFVHQMNVFNFYGINIDDYNVITVGYYIYRQISLPETTLAEYPYYAAFGLIMTFITIPATLGLKWGMTKFGPATD